jgi:hypothetical protein
MLLLLLLRTLLTKAHTFELFLSSSQATLPRAAWTDRLDRPEDHKLYPTRTLTSFRPLVASDLENNIAT